MNFNGKYVINGLSTINLTKKNHLKTAANGLLVLIGVACKPLERQWLAQATAFKTEGGFTERLYRYRQQNRK